MAKGGCQDSVGCQGGVALKERALYAIPLEPLQVNLFGEPCSFYRHASHRATQNNTQACVDNQNNPLFDSGIVPHNPLFD